MFGNDVNGREGRALSRPQRSPRRAALPVCLSLLAVASALAEPQTGVVRSADGTAPSDYVPAMVSNGRLNVFIDPTLGVARETKAYGKMNLQPGIWWEGRRLVDNKGVASRFGYPLLPQGDFRTVVKADGRETDAATAWTQRLDVRQALCTVENEFACGVKLVGETFVPRSRDVIAVRQTVTAADGPHEVELGVRYAAPQHVRIQGSWTKTAVGAAWKMRTFGRFVTDETIGVEPDGFRPEVVLADGCATLTAKFRLEMGESKTLAWFVTYADDLEKSLPLINPVEKEKGPLPSYAALRERHLADWRDYFAASEIVVPDARIRALSDMARYHLRCVATEWSIPVGIVQSHWQGKIFAFDEMYAAQGLLSSGQFETARVAADFRAATVKDACIRCNKNPSKPFRGFGARWLWEGMEGNTIEGSPIGYWFDHIFHQAAIAQTVWSYYRYTDDLAWLKQKGYDVLRECALFFRRLYVQDMPDGTSFVTKCTDLERLGPGHERAFMTTCGVIMTLRTAAEAAELVGQDADLVADFRACADRLVLSLPEKDGRYVAYPGCTDESMGTLAGLYPFRTFDRSNAAQVKAVRHFLANGEAFGNMYATGRRICPWYAATMAMASLRAGDDKHPPMRWLTEAFRSAGCWGEYWEINEPGVSQFRPWFMTAAGNCLYAINQLFVADMDGALHLAAGVPDAWRAFSFRLPAPGGLTIRMAVKDDRLTELSVDVNNPSARKVKLVLPSKYGLAPQEVSLEANRVAVIGAGR